MTEKDFLSDFPSAFFIEEEIETHFPKTAQLSKDQFDMRHLLAALEKRAVLFLFYETGSADIPSERKALSRLFSGRYENIVVYIPFPSIETMKKVLTDRQDWVQAGFKGVFFDQNNLNPI
jgi:hypothetical protein